MVAPNSIISVLLWWRYEVTVGKSVYQVHYLNECSIWPVATNMLYHAFKVTMTSTTIHSILNIQFTCLTFLFCTTSLHGLPLGLTPSTSYSLHFFIQTLSSFRSTCPYNRNLFCCSTEIRPMSSIITVTSH